MNAIERELRSVFEDERRTIATPEGLADSVTTRIRRRRMGSAVGATVSTLAVAGAAATVPLAFSHLGSSTVTPAATADPTAYDAEMKNMAHNALGLQCGDPVSEAGMRERAGDDTYVFVGPIDVPEPASGGPADGIVVNGGDYVYGVYARDGVVVGFSAMRPFTFDDTPGLKRVELSFEACPSVLDDSTGGLLPGTYFEYLVTDGTATNLDGSAIDGTVAP